MIASDVLLHFVAKAMSMQKLLFLPGLARFEDLALLFFRLLVGLPIVSGALGYGPSLFPLLTFLPIPVLVQVSMGLGIAIGLLSRWSGLLCGCGFAAAAALVQVHGGAREAFPFAMLSSFGFYMASRGAGKLSADAMILSRFSSPNKYDAG
jgi:hypothetical protein